jgi:catechol 2,3-dioxygenase-like lactoylglutathione lyase family enzyme
MTNARDAEKMDRRELLRNIVLGAAATSLPTLGAAKGLRGTAINHVSYESADYKKTRDFYVDLLGFQASDEDEKQLYLWAGDTLISAKNTPAAREPIVDHFGFTVEPWDLNSVEVALKERGLTVRLSRNDPHDSSTKSAFTRDPNGYIVQLCARDLETKPAEVASQAPLKAVSINDISYQCPDYKKARDFYTELLGMPVSNDNGNQAYLWFGDAFMMVRNNADEGTKPVIDHIAWTLAHWDRERVSAELKKRGLDAHVDATGKSILTKDINGYSLQLCSRDLEKRP